MWLLKVVLIFLTLALCSGIYLFYGEAIAKFLRVFFSSFKSVFYVIFAIFLHGLKATVAGTVLGGIFMGIFAIAGAPLAILKMVAVFIGGLCFVVLMLKALLEEGNNLRWSFRHAVRNQYRPRRVR